MSKKTRRAARCAVEGEVVLEALRNEATIAELAARYQLHPNRIYARKKRLLAGAAAVCSSGEGGEPGGALREDRSADSGAGFI